MNKVFITGLLTALGAVVVTFIQANGLPATGVAWIVLLITILGNLLIYLGKNAIKPSTSTFLNVNIGDMISGLILAIGSALVSFAAAAITSTSVDYALLWHTAVTVGVTYVMTKFGFGPKATTPATTA